MAAANQPAAILLCAAVVAAASPEFQSAKRLQEAGKAAEAQAAFQTIARRAAQGSEEQALAYIELSRIDLDAGRYASAIANGGLAHGSLRRQSDLTNDGKALTLSAMARLYSGAYDAALEEMEQALAIARSTKDRAAEVTRLNNVGTIYYFEARYADALDKYRAAMLLVDASAGQGWVPSRRQLSAANIATVYQKMGQYQRALDTYSKLLASGNALAPTEQAQLIANIGTLYRRLGDPIKALATYREAQDLYRQHGMRNGEIAVLNNIGIAQGLDLGRLEDARQTFNQALSLAETSKDRPVALHSLLYRAETEYRLNRFQEADEDFTKANLLSRELHAKDDEWKALFGMSRIEDHKGRSLAAENLLQNAVVAIESLRGAGPGDLRSGFLADKRQVYDALLNHLAQHAQSGADEMLRLMELSRARDAQDKNKSMKATTVSQIQQFMPADALMLEYTVAQDFVLVLWISHKESGFWINRQEPGLRQRLAGLNARLSRVADRSWQAAAQELSSLLLGGVSKELASANLREIIVVPDREVTGVPFDALPNAARTADLLVRRFSLTYLPSANLIAKTHLDRQTLLFTQRTLVALADPAPGAGTDLALVPGLADTGRLPAAVEEVQQISAMVGGKTATYVGQEAKTGMLTESLSRGFPLVHLATHAYSDPEDPARSYLLFAPARSGQLYDPMFLKEVESLHLKSVDLVTVSACETEAGKLVEGEGVESFSRAFLKAGRAGNSHDPVAS